MKNKYFITLGIILAVIGIFAASISFKSDMTAPDDTASKGDMQVPVQAAAQPDTAPVEQKNVYSDKKYAYLPDARDYLPLVEGNDTASKGEEGIYSESYEEAVNPAAIQTAAAQPDTAPVEQKNVYSVKKYVYLPDVRDYLPLVEGNDTASKGEKGIYSESYEEAVNPAAINRITR